MQLHGRWQCYSFCSALWATHHSPLPLAQGQGAHLGKRTETPRSEDFAILKFFLRLSKDNFLFKSADSLGSGKTELMDN